MIAFAGCKKYDDGPTISIMPKKMRLDRTWKVEKTITAGQTTTGSNDNTVQFKGDGTVISSMILGSGTFTNNGTWEFGSKKETIRITYGSSTSEATILRLTTKEFWIKDNSFPETETHFIPSK